jgi:hypothetical protein
MQTLECKKICLDRNAGVWNAKATSKNAGTRHAKGLQEWRPALKATVEVIELLK